VAASITDTGARALRLPAEDRRLLLAAALAAGWGAAFAVPITGMAFAWRFARRQRIRALPLTALAAVAAERTVSALGYEHRRPAPVGDVDWSVGLILLLVVAGLLFGVLARWFVASLRRVRGLAARHLPHPAARGAVGGFALLLLVAIAGRDVLGLSLPLLDDSLGGGTTPWWTAPMKLVATAVSLGTGFVGGDVTPLFVIGASAGATIASVVGAASARVSLVAALGSTVTFGAASSATVVGVILAAERFGRHAIVPALVVALAARLAAGRPALYAESH
jgi:H+/Cl- antiporter ClcA